MKGVKIFTIAQKSVSNSGVGEFCQSEINWFCAMLNHSIDLKVIIVVKCKHKYNRNSILQ